MGASSELPHGGRGGHLGCTRLLRLGRHLRHLDEVLTRSARGAAAPTFALAVAAAFLLPGGQGDRPSSSSRGALHRRLHVRLAAAWLRLGPRNRSGIAAAPILR